MLNQSWFQILRCSFSGIMMAINMSQKYIFYEIGLPEYQNKVK